MVRHDLEVGLYHLDYQKTILGLAWERFLMHFILILYYDWINSGVVSVDWINPGSLFRSFQLAAFVVITCV